MKLRKVKHFHNVKLESEFWLFLNTKVLVDSLWFLLNPGTFSSQIVQPHTHDLAEWELNLTEDKNFEENRN
jgi:hypothetical protein